MELCNTIIKSSVESASSYVYWTAIYVVNQYLTDRVVSGFLAHQNCIFNDSTTPDSIARPANEFVCWYHSVKTLHLQIIVVKCRCQVEIMTPTDRTTFFSDRNFVILLYWSNSVLTCFVFFGCNRNFAPMTSVKFIRLGPTIDCNRMPPIRTRLPCSHEKSISQWNEGR